MPFPPFQWVPYSGGDIPTNMVRGGQRYNDEPLYVCRGKIDGVDVSGKFYPVNKTAYFPYDGKERTFSSCEILCSDSPDLLSWVPATDGAIKGNSVFVGYDVKGILYVGRGSQSSELIPGKIHPPDGCCYVSTQNKEWALTEYDVLVYGS